MKGAILSDPTLHCRYFLRADQAAVGLARPHRVLPACLRAKYFSGPGDVAASHVWQPPQHLCGAIPPPIQSGLLPVAPVVLPGSPVFAQSSLNPPEEKPPEKERPSHQYVLLPHWAAKRFVESETHEKTKGKGGEIE